MLTTADKTITKIMTPSGTNMYSTPSGGPNSSKGSTVVVVLHVLVAFVALTIPLVDVVAFVKFHRDGTVVCCGTCVVVVLLVVVDVMVDADVTADPSVVVSTRIFVISVVTTLDTSCSSPIATGMTVVAFPSPISLLYFQQMKKKEKN